MKKQLLWSLFLLVPLGACGTTQQIYWNHVVWMNNCSSDVEVQAIDYTNTSAEPASVKVKVRQGESAQVGLYMAAPGNNAADQLSPRYKLVLLRGQSALEIDHQKMRELLSKISPGGRGTSRDWVIQDSSTCP